jgi:hypothetical protein
MFWKTSREASAQLRSLMREKEALRPQIFFSFFSVVSGMASPPIHQLNSGGFHQSSSPEATIG